MLEGCVLLFQEEIASSVDALIQVSCEYLRTQLTYLCLPLYISDLT